MLHSLPIPAQTCCTSRPFTTASSTKMSKRTLDSFFQPSPNKKPKTSTTDPTNTSSNHTTSIPSQAPIDDLLTPSPSPPSIHPTYPFPIVQLPTALSDTLITSTPGHEGKPITNAPDLDLLYFQPFIPRASASALFTHLRATLPFYRVKYSISRGATPTEINTPRYTTVFGLDASAAFSSSPASPSSSIVDSKTSRPVPASAYKCAPRPIPGCLDLLRRLVEAFTGAEYNFVLVNYYADGRDSISYHSDDERFLGDEPVIASLSLGGTRDFLMRHKPLAVDARADATKGIYGNRGTVGGKGANGGGGGSGGGGEKVVLTAEEEAIREAHKNPLKLPMAGGDMVLMRGRSQSHWLHSVPKRSGKGVDGGRINITFRKALVKGGTENYYQYNVGRGPPMKWDAEKKEMVEWKPGGTEAKENEVEAEAQLAAKNEKDDEAWTRKSNKYGIPFERKWHDT